MQWHSVFASAMSLDFGSERVDWFPSLGLGEGLALLREPRWGDSPGLHEKVPQAVIGQEN